MRTRKIFALILTGVLSAGLFAGCKSTPPAASKDHIFKAESILSGGEDYDYFNGMVFDGSDLYMLASNTVMSGSETGDVGISPMPITPRIRGGGAVAVVSVAETSADDEVDDEIEEDTIETAADEIADEDIAADDTELIDDTIADDAVMPDIVLDDMPDYYADNPVTYTYYNYLLKVSRTGEIAAVKELSVTTDDFSNVNYSSLSLAADGGLYAIKQTSRYGSKDDGSYFNENSNELVYFDKDLNETVVLNINEALTSVLENEEDYIWVSNFVVGKDGNIYLNSNNHIYVINPDTKAVIVNYKPESENDYIQGMYMLPSGSVGVQINGYEQTDGEFKNTFKFAPIEVSSGKLGADMDFPRQYNLIPGDGNYDYYYFDQMGVYGYDLDTNSNTIIVDLLASGIADMGLNTIVPLSATEFAAMGYNNADGSMSIYSLKKVDPADLPEKQLVTVAALFQDYYLTQYIMAYNKQNTVYQIEFKNYSSDPSLTYDQMLTAFNNDIIAGKVPDVILVDNSMPYDSFVSKGLLMDLSKRFDEDETIALEDLVDSVVNALKTADGKLYSIGTSFSMQTFAGKTSIFGEKPGLTMTELEAAAGKIPGAKLFSSYTTREDFMNQFVYNMIGNYIDKDTGECHFNTPEFISLLNLVKSFPEEIDYENYDYMSEALSYKEDRVLVSNEYIYDFRNIVRLEKATFDAPVTYLGFPNSDGKSGVIAQFTDELAIMAKAKNPDGAWDFLKGMLSYHDVNSNSISEMTGQFPIFKAEMESYAAKAKEKPYYIDYETKEKVEYDNSSWIGDTQITIPDNTDADNAKVFALIDSISTILRSENELKKIIEDDLKTFYSGQKSAEETAEIIQNRASTYIAESR